MPLTGKEMVKLLEKDGFTWVRTKGSHQIYYKEGIGNIPIPVHGNRALGKGLEQKILKDAGLK